MRISDWSSDVCSSDLFGGNVRERLYRGQWQKMTPDFATVSPINAVDRIKAPLLLIHGKKDVTVDVVQSAKMYSAMVKAGKEVEYLPIQIGRASCRERVCQYV